eukprot:CAMPEP_0118981138 /NCGR_PEP_ID=MMETSP1173-20130426/29921_1 /TAXON_ID=1034831 /ORGANISM="Rhizochromulina marina cf, Strain CCMP1243" /LENGTH=129 /DNA_ID=CAMNT_0006931537 /DNA_START=709 /DNA_END=1099 /DNA_ORIENTATION=+
MTGQYGPATIIGRLSPLGDVTWNRILMFPALSAQGHSMLCHQLSYFWSPVAYGRLHPTLQLQSLAAQAPAHLAREMAASAEVSLLFWRSACSAPQRATAPQGALTARRPAPWPYLPPTPMQKAAPTKKS